MITGQACFELSSDWRNKISQPSHRHHVQHGDFPQATNRANRRKTCEIGIWRIPLETQRKAMGIDWMTLPELSEAIPPAYSEWLACRWKAIRANSDDAIRYAR